MWEKSQVVFDFVGASSTATLFFGSRNFGTKRTRSACKAFKDAHALSWMGLGKLVPLGATKCAVQRWGCWPPDSFKAKFPGGKPQIKQRKGDGLEKVGMIQPHPAQLPRAKKRHRGTETLLSWVILLPAPGPLVLMVLSLELLRSHRFSSPVETKLSFQANSSRAITDLFCWMTSMNIIDGAMFALPLDLHSCSFLSRSSTNSPEPYPSESDSFSRVNLRRTKQSPSCKFTFETATLFQRMFRRHKTN